MIELMLFVTMLGALLAGHFAQRCHQTAREIRDELRRHHLFMEAVESNRLEQARE